jgi:hypothetical protein
LSDGYSVAATEVASHWLCIEIALRLAAAKRTLGRITGRGAPRLLAVTAYYRRAKTPDRILHRDKRRVSVIGPVPLCAFPRRGPRSQTRICPECRRGDQEQHAQPDTKKKQGRSALNDGQAPSMTITAGHGVSQPQWPHPYEEPTILAQEYRLSGDDPPSGESWRHGGEMRVQGSSMHTVILADTES